MYNKVLYQAVQHSHENRPSQSKTAGAGSFPHIQNHCSGTASAVYIYICNHLAIVSVLAVWNELTHAL